MVPSVIDGDRAAEVVDALLADYRFAGVAAVARVLGLPSGADRRVASLAAAGERLLDLDAEDFDVIAAEVDLPSDVVQPVRDAQFPRTPNAKQRGSLRSLVPLYRLMLEALNVRWIRREPIHVVVLLHLVAEYLPLLAWEKQLGDAGDPARLARFTSVLGSKWGTQDRGCDHTAAQRSAAARVVHATRGDADGWTVYLDRFHSRVSDALGRCASHPDRGRPALEGVCRRPCSVWTQLPRPVQSDLGARVHLARLYAKSPAVELRHHAPVGHFFGVPSPDEIASAWQRSWEKLVRPWSGDRNPLAALEVDKSSALPGMGALVTAVAGRPVAAGTVLATIREALSLELAPVLRGTAGT
jgi:hypothetical protein